MKRLMLSVTKQPSSDDKHLPHIRELLDWLAKSTERMNKVAKLLESK